MLSQLTPSEQQKDFFRTQKNSKQKKSAQPVIPNQDSQRINIDSRIKVLSQSISDQTHLKDIEEGEGFTIVMNEAHKNSSILHSSFRKNSILGENDFVGKSWRRQSLTKIFDKNIAKAPTLEFSETP